MYVMQGLATVGVLHVSRPHAQPLLRTCNVRLDVAYVCMRKWSQVCRLCLHWTGPGLVVGARALTAGRDTLGDT